MTAEKVAISIYFGQKHVFEILQENAVVKGRDLG